MQGIRRRLVLSAIAIALAVLGMPQSAHADVNNFHFSNFEADYYLSRDQENRSRVRVIERLTAQFPDFNQNKGIERAIPLRYDGHPVSFHLESLKRNGQPEPIYEQRTENGNKIIATGTDEYIQGTQVFEFTYTLRDVIKDSGSYQELFWDTNGTEWYQSFARLTARIHLDSSIRDAFTDETVCFQGASGSKEVCSAHVQSSMVQFESSRVLASGENLTFGLKFKSSTFTERPFSLLDVINYVPVALTLLLIIVSLYVRLTFNRNHPGRGTIVPEYLPPAGISVLQAAQLYKTSADVPAQIVDLAVRHNLRIIESDEKGPFNISNKKYTVEILNTQQILEDEKAFLQALIGDLAPGSSYKLDSTDRARGLVMKTLTASYESRSVRLGLRQENKVGQWAAGVLMIANVAIIALSFLLMFLYQEGDPLIAFVSIFGAFVGIFVSGLLVSGVHPLTEKGREVYDYLKGLEMYIKLAEVDRLKLLQSPDGAEKTPVDTSSNTEVVKLYERVLPYAILFGQEKEWAKQLSVRYEQLGSQPDWYRGTSAFSAATFASSFGGFSSTANSYGYSSQSSSGGFSGGGSSGGGGGGGGGGGR